MGRGRECEGRCPSSKAIRAIRVFYQDALKIAGGQGSDRLSQPDGRAASSISGATPIIRTESGAGRRRASYASDSTDWTTLIDMGRARQGRGARTGYGRARAASSPRSATVWSTSPMGGEDAVSVREFDLQTGKFVEGGFALPQIEAIGRLARSRQADRCARLGRGGR